MARQIEGRTRGGIIEIDGVWRSKKPAFREERGLL
jgi:hypothetical protein